MRKLRDTTFAHFAGDAVLGSISPFEIWNGGDGDDVHVGTGSDDTLNGNGGNDTLSGGDGGDLLDGGAGNDILAGDLGDDALNGGIGDDTITSTSGADAVDGGDGNDKWIGSYASATTAFTFDQRTGALSNGTTLTGIEAIQLTAGSGADTFTMNGDQTFAVDAGAGSDTFIFDPTDGTRSAAPLAVTIAARSSGFAVKLEDDRGTNLAEAVEHVALTGSSGDDTFALDQLESRKDRTLAIDGGLGHDVLTWDLAYQSGFRFIVRDDDTVDSNAAVVANFEQYFFTASYGGSNTISLGVGDDTISLGGRYNTVGGGGGDDTISLTGYGAVIDGGSGSDVIRAGGNRSTVDGGDGDDIIYAADPHSRIDGGAGFDRWIGQLRKEISFDQTTGKFSNGLTLIDFESLSLSTSSNGRGTTLQITQASDLSVTSNNLDDRIVINLTGLAIGTNLTVSVGAGSTGRLAFGDTRISTRIKNDHIAQISFTGTGQDDTIMLADRTATTIIPTLDGGAGFDTLSLHLGSSGQFSVSEDGVIISSFGHYADFEQFDITAYDGDNTIALVGGDDTITVLASATGTNDLSGGGGADVITGALGTDTIRGGDGDDTLAGGDGDDLINGGLGDDTIDGGAGIDSVGYDGATAGVTVSLLKVGVAQDTKGAGIDTLTGIENLFGTEFKDKLIGDAFANLLRGREGDDLLKGGAGNDRLEGGPGVDRLAGGKGADTFAFMKLTDISLGAPDRITDFRHTDADKIELSNIDLSKDAGDQAFTFIGTSVFTGRTDIFELRVQDIGNKTYIVQGDVNHDGVADFTFDVKTDGPLVANDFVL